MARMGRPSLFGPKDVDARYQGLMTTAGSKLFETEREWIARTVGIAVKSVSDGDVFESLARGREKSERILLRHRT